MNASRPLVFSSLAIASLPLPFLHSIAKNRQSNSRGQASRSSFDDELEDGDNTRERALILLCQKERHCLLYLRYHLSHVTRVVLSVL
ncbi:hypothetical protein BJ165DRAFT_1466075 [Panaeolus papilionaceus]|nr:hypothetical protein BJ165DRAFT_1466075 [Panaeolus papilionaceus]